MLMLAKLDKEINVAPFGDEVSICRRPEYVQTTDIEPMTMLGNPVSFLRNKVYHGTSRITL